MSRKSEPTALARRALCLTFHTSIKENPVLHTQVGIVGAGPAGLMLSHLLHRAGIGSVVLERGSRDHIGTRLRAGGLEHGTVDLLKQAGLGERLQQIGLTVRSTDFRFDNAGHRVDYAATTGHTYTIYPQYEIIKDLVDARDDAQEPIRFDCPVSRIDDLDSDRPTIHFTEDGEPKTLTCDFIAGCDGFHGVCRQAIPSDILRLYEEVYPFGWLGILAEVPPESLEVAYSCHDEGFAMTSFRSPSVSRLYLQCAPDDRAENWSDDRIWQSLHTRLDVPNRPPLAEGRITQKSVTAMRSFVAEPMRYGNLFLAGDAAHIVPPTGAKGLNAALADIATLSRGLIAHYRDSNDERLDRYSEICLRRNWQVQRFSADLCRSLHRFPDASAFARRVQLLHLEYMTETLNGQRWYAENFVGLPFYQ
jgi:p-hydroxybenzoate 3-monooxygenase